MKNEFWCRGCNYFKPLGAKADGLEICNSCKEKINGYKKNTKHHSAANRANGKRYKHNKQLTYIVDKLTENDK